MVGGRPAGVPRQRDHPVVRRDPFAGASVARGHRSGRPSARTWGSRCAPACPASDSGCRTIRRSAVAAFIKPHARIIHDYTRRHIYIALRYSSEPARHSARRHVHGRDQQDLVARGGRADRLVHHHGVQDLFGNRAGEAARRPIWRDEPAVDFNLLSDQRDLERMMDGVRRFGAMHLTPDHAER